MNPRLTLLAAALVLGSAPLPALAQTWPATVVASAPRMLPSPARPFVVVRDDEVSTRRQAGVPPTDPTPRTATLKLSAPAEIPQVDVRPKAEWSDDQGWRASPTRVAFKRRF